jgi:hypothetical protein
MDEQQTQADGRAEELAMESQCTRQGQQVQDSSIDGERKGRGKEGWTAVESTE